MLGKVEGKKRRGWQRMRWLDSITNSMDMNLSKFWEIVKDRGAWLVVVHGVVKSWIWLEQLSNNNKKLKQKGLTMLLAPPGKWNDSEDCSLVSCRWKWKDQKDLILPALLYQHCETSRCQHKNTILLISGSPRWKDLVLLLIETGAAGASSLIQMPASPSRDVAALWSLVEELLHALCRRITSCPWKSPAPDSHAHEKPPLLGLFVYISNVASWILHFKITDAQPGWRSDVWRCNKKDMTLLLCIIVLSKCVPGSYCFMKCICGSVVIDSFINASRIWRVCYAPGIVPSVFKEGTPKFGKGDSKRQVILI